MRRDAGLILVCVFCGWNEIAYAIPFDSLVDKYSYYINPIVNKYYSGDKSKFISELKLLYNDFVRIKNMIEPKVKEHGPYSLKIGTLAPKGTAWLSVVETLIVPFINDLTDGALKIIVYPSGTMGEDRDIIRKIKLNQLHGCGCTIQGVIMVSPEMAVLTMPFMFNKYEEVDAVIGALKDEFADIFKKKNYYLFALIDTGFFYIFTRNKIETFEELSKQKFCTWFGELEIELLHSLNIAPFSIPVPEIPNALHLGVLYAILAPPSWVLGTQSFTALKYYVEIPMMYAPAAIFFNVKSLYREGDEYGLSGTEIDRILNGITKMVKILHLEDYWNEQLRNFEREALDGFLKYGLVPLKLKDVEVEKIKNKALSVLESKMGNYFSAELHKKVLNALNAYRSSH